MLSESSVRKPGLPQVDSLAAIHLVAENLESLHDNAAGDDGVCGGDGRDDVTSHALHLEPVLLLDVEDKHPDVSTGGDEI